MFLVHVKLVEGAFTGPQKRQLADRLTDAVLAPAGEGIGGETVSLDDMRALAREQEPE